MTSDRALCRTRLLTFEIFDDKLFRRARLRIRQIRRDFIDAVRVADRQRRKVCPFLCVGRGGSRRIRHDDDVVLPACVVGLGFVGSQLCDVRGCNQLDALGGASVIHHRREIGGSSGGGGGGGGGSSGRPLHLCCRQDLGTRKFRHMRASCGRWPFRQYIRSIVSFALNTHNRFTTIRYD